MNQTKTLSNRKQRTGFVEHTLVDINNTLEQSLFAEKIAQQKGLLQGLDPRLKIVCMLLLLIAVSLSHQLIVIAILYLGVLILAARSKVPIGFFIKRVWVFIPFFTGIIALPAIFITPGPVLFQISPWLAITRTGVMTALFLLLRVGTSVSMGILFILTTPWNSVLKALGVLRVPDVIILTLGMTYRYIHLLLHITNDMFLSRKSRILRWMNSKEQRHLMAASTGVLIGKSLQVSSEVYLAMISRGYHDYPRTMDTFKMSEKDWISFIIVIIITVAAVWFGRRL